MILKSSAPSLPPRADKADSTAAVGRGERIAKVLARAGLCSRREAERWIADGRVALDGATLTSPAVTVDDASRVTVDGKALPSTEPTRLWRYHKPAGLLTSHGDPRGRPTVFDKLPPQLGRVISVGRLDLNSEGLLLLTNDGALARRLELPSTGWRRRYRVRVHGTPDAPSLARLAKGIVVDGVRYGPIEADLNRQQGANAWLTVSLAEGKNREIRKVMEHLGWPVSRLIRIAYGPFQLGHLPKGGIEAVPGKVLNEQLGAGTAPKRVKWSKDAHRRRPS
jgi:23S rRNA pseudouridine2605 synthase